MIDAGLAGAVIGGLVSVGIAGGALLWRRMHEYKHRAEVLGVLLEGELKRNSDLLDMNYMLAGLNEDLYAHLDQRNPMVAAPWRRVQMN